MSFKVEINLIKTLPTGEEIHFSSLRLEEASVEIQAGMVEIPQKGGYRTFEPTSQRFLTIRGEIVIAGRIPDESETRPDMG